MKQMTKQELIELIKEKQANANIDFDKIELDGKPSTIATMYNLVGNVRAYEDIIALLESTEIVADKIEANPNHFVGGKPLDTICQNCDKVGECEVADDKVKICENYANSWDKVFKTTIINLLNQILRAIKNK